MNLYFIVRNFPPVNSARAIQLAHWLRHLRARSYVFCENFSGPKFLDTTILPDLPERSVVVPVPAPKGSLEEKPVFKALGRMLPFSLECVRTSRRFTAEFFRLVSASHLRRDSVLLTMSKSEAAHLAGLKIKKKTGMPWAAFFSDPWTDNPYFPIFHADLAIQRFFERKVAEKADLLFFPTEEFKNHFMSRYRGHERKAEVIPHCFEPSLYPAQAGEGDPGIYLIRHMGHLYGPRQPLPIIEAFRAFHEKFPEKASVFRFEFVGKARFNLDFLKWPEGDRFFRFIPPVDYRTALRMTKESDRLLVLEAPRSPSPCRVLKLIESLGAGRPVWAVTPRGSATETFVKKLPASFASDSSDPESILKVLHELHGRYLEKKDRLWQCPPDIYEAHRAEHVVRKVEHSLNRLVRA